jgi:hypothetical protein
MDNSSHSKWHLFLTAAGVVIAIIGTLVAFFAWQYPRFPVAETNGKTDVSASVFSGSSTPVPSPSSSQLPSPTQSPIMTNSATNTNSAGNVALTRKPKKKKARTTSPVEDECYGYDESGECVQCSYFNEEGECVVEN